MNPTGIIDKSLAAIAILDMYPPSIRNELIKDSSFRKEYGVATEGDISFSNGLIVFQRSAFFEAIRQAYELLKTSVNDKDGNEWSLITKTGENGTEVIISLKSQELRFNEFWPLCPNIKDRLSIFNRKADRINLPVHTKNYWIEELSLPVIYDDLIQELSEDFQNTPDYIFTRLQEEMQEGSSCLSMLAPENEVYYERLIGVYKNSEDITKYATLELSEHFNHLFSLGNYSGYYLSLLTASHSTSSIALSSRPIDSNELKNLIDDLITRGDVVSQVGAIEVIFQKLSEIPDLESKLTSLIKSILKDGSTKDEKFTLLSSLVILVDGQLSRMNIFKKKPVFYRRLASFTQAGLITRSLMQQGTKFKDITKWAYAQNGEMFYYQSLIDLHSEPRWLPDYISPQQLKQEFFGRVYTVASTHKDKIKDKELLEIIFGDNKESLKNKIGMDANLPGPLEGGVEPQYIPPELQKLIENGLNKESTSLETFIALINCSSFWRFDNDNAEQVSKILRTANHQLNEVGDPEKIFSLLYGLSMVASMNRNPELAGELKILTRRYGSFLSEEQRGHQLLVIGLVAAAAHEDFDMWIKYLGDWLSELAYKSWNKNELATLHARIKQLCIIEPQLFRTSSRALAALEQFVQG
jgi:hypothetical protein